MDEIETNTEIEQNPFSNIDEKFITDVGLIIEALNYLAILLNEAGTTINGRRKPKNEVNSLELDLAETSDKLYALADDFREYRHRNSLYLSNLMDNSESFERLIAICDHIQCRELD